MLVVAGFIIVGFILDGKIRRWTDRMIRLGLYLLLIAMGLSLGNNEQIFLAIPSLGMKALVFCIMSCLISIIMVVLWERLFIHRFIRPKGKARNFSIGKEGRMMLMLILCLGFGILAGRRWLGMPLNLPPWMFNIALFLICIGIGATIRASTRFLTHIKKGLWVYAIVPVLITIGSLVGGLIAGLITGQNPVDSAAISGTMVFYSFASVIITKQSGFDVGLLALLSNILRELAMFALGPVLARYSDLAPLAVGGASTMDVTLPVIKRSLAEEYTVLAVFNGMVLSIVVPILLMLLYGLI